MASANVQWSSRLAFILAAVGSAVGLGNIWRFPYLAGENGGAAFVLLYIAFVFIIGLPVLIAELSVGRRGGLSPIGSVKKIAAESKLTERWKWLGHLGTFGGGLGLLSLYSVIAGWVMAYIIEAAIGVFSGITAEGATAAMNDYKGDAGTMTFWHFLFTAITVIIVGKGIKGGLEKAVTYLMPILFLILLLLLGYAMAQGDFAAGFEFLFTPDFSKINGDVALMALGQAFFSLSVTVGTMIAYGSYLPKEVSIHKSAGLIAAADTGVALIAGLAIFPFVFAFGLAPDSGPTLIFVTLPQVFGQMPGGDFVGTAFFTLLTIAAITSSISLLEPAVSYFEEKMNMTRWRAAIIAGGTAFTVGLLTVFSNNSMADSAPLAMLGIEMNYGEIIDFTIANIIMPVGGLIMAIFVGWFVKREFMKDELGLPEGGIFEIWHVLLKFVCPLALIWVLVMGLM